MKTLKDAHEESCRGEGLSTEDIRKDWEQTKAEYNSFLDEVTLDAPPVTEKVVCADCGDEIEGTPCLVIREDDEEAVTLCAYCARANEEDGEYDPFLTDAEADADVLASAGWGTDEDYGCYGGEDF
jgi:hypothetical protein